MSLYPGVATRDITPKKPLFLIGYPHVPRTSTGTHDPLLSTALCLKDGTTSMLWIANDILFLSRESVKLCREAIRKATGIPEANILLSATHTHSGPVTAAMMIFEADPVVPPPDPEYMAQFHQAIIDAGINAVRNMVPAELTATTALVEGVGGNRLSDDGVRDPEANILLVRRAVDHSPLAINIVYGMHPTVMHEDSTLVSGDFPAFTRQHLQEILPGVAVVYHNGPSGNQSPRRYVKGQTFAEAERLGRMLGRFVTDKLSTLKTTDFQREVRLASARRFLEFPARRFPSVADAHGTLRSAVENFERLKQENAGHSAIRTAECVVFGAEELVTLARAQADGRTESMRKQYGRVEVQVFRVGDHSIVGLPGELFVEYGQAIKQHAPGKVTVIELVNGELQGYIVTPEADAAGGYEATCSFFRPESGRLMVDAAVKMIGSLAK